MKFGGLTYEEIRKRAAEGSLAVVPTGCTEQQGPHLPVNFDSIALHLRHESVRVERIPDPQRGSVDWDDPELDFADYSSTGVIGDPTYASAVLGASLWRAVVEEAGLVLRGVAEAALT